MSLLTSLCAIKSCKCPRGVCVEVKEKRKEKHECRSRAHKRSVRNMQEKEEGGQRRLCVRAGGVGVCRTSKQSRTRRLARRLTDGGGIGHLGGDGGGMSRLYLGVCDGVQILRFFIVSALFLSRSPTSCSERR